MTEWDQILREKWYSQEEPEELAVNFAANLQRRRKIRVLDLGCGAGRHLVYMATQGFDTYGVDISKTGLNQTKERLRRRKAESNLVKCDMKMLPYVDSCFGAVISLNTLYHQKLEGIQQTVSEIHRVLKKEGLVLINFLSKRTFSHAKGVEIEEGTFVEQQGIEKGVLHHFVDEEEIRSLFEKFKIVDLTLSEKVVEGKLRSRWIVQATV